MANKLTIRCKIHGAYEQTPSNHITHQQGCQRCAGNVHMTTAEFIEKAKAKHHDQFDYEEVSYVNRYTKVCIKCKDHGSFYQTPVTHLSGYGCVGCANINRSEKQKTTLSAFIAKANVVHNNVFNYEKVVYVTARIPVTILCPFHGEFDQVPDVHLRGCGCFKCHSTHSKMQIKWLTFMATFTCDEIQHAENGGEYTVPETRYRADGYSKKTNTIYEFHGDYWHGNPKKYAATDTNTVSKKTFGELYQNTMKKEARLKELGYHLVTMWEYDWMIILNGVCKLQRLFRASFGGAGSRSP